MSVLPDLIVILDIYLEIARDCDLHCKAHSYHSIFIIFDQNELEYILFPPKELPPRLV